jgi:hypothetical protein
MLRRAQSGTQSRRLTAILPWLLVTSMVGACNVLAHTDDYSVGSAADGGIGALSDGNAATDARIDALREAAADQGISSPDGAAPCDPTIAMGAISTPGGYQSAIGNGGYVYPFDDRAGSLSCLASTALCGAGSTAVASDADWGAALGLNLNQAMATGSTVNPYKVPSAATGIAVFLSNIPAETRVSIDHGGVEYCVALPGASATVPWSQFNTECWNNQGDFLSGPPDDATFIHVIVPAIASARVYDFCVISLSFALAPGAPDAGPDGATDAASSGTGDAAPEE